MFIHVCWGVDLHYVIVNVTVIINMIKKTTNDKILDEKKNLDSMNWVKHFSEDFYRIAMIHVL